MERSIFSAVLKRLGISKLQDELRIIKSHTEFLAFNFT